MSVTVLPPSSPTVEPPRVAFAVPRAVGPAVVRNRLRRQVRAHLVERRRDDRFPSGAWLFALHPEAVAAGRTALLADVDDCIDRLETRPGSSR